MTNLSRRKLLQASAAATAGGAAALTLTSEPAQAAPVGSSRVGRVLRQVGDAAEVELLRPGTTQVTGVVTVPVAGFPDGWTLRAGDRVIVTGQDDPERPSTAMPLVTRLVGRVDRVGAATVVVAGRTVHLRTQTLQTRASAEEASYEAYVIANDRDGTLSCTTLRPVS